MAGLSLLLTSAGCSATPLPSPSPPPSATPAPQHSSTTPPEPTATANLPSPTPERPLAARVNGEPIYVADYERELQRYGDSLKAQGIDPDSQEGQDRLNQARGWILNVMIEQILTNLVTNACDAMPNGGVLTINAVSADQNIVLTVTDTGCGISDEDMERMFEPLFTTKPRGIGLGLAITKMLVEANRGTIDVASEKNAGTTFTLNLPTTEALG